MARGRLHFHTTHPQHPKHLHSDSPKTSEFTYDEKSNRIMLIIGAVLSSLGVVLLTLSILGFVEVIIYGIAIPFLIASVCLLALGIQFLISSLSDKKKAANMVKCPGCGAYNYNLVLVCYKCGKNLLKEATNHSCGARPKSEGEVCPDSGHEEVKTEASQDKESL